MMGLDIFGCELVVTSVKFSVTKYDPGLCEITATTEMNIGYIKKNSATALNIISKDAL